MKLSYTYQPPVTTTDIFFGHFPHLSHFILVLDRCIDPARIAFLGKPDEIITVDAGEAIKSRDAKALLEDKLIQFQAGPDAHIVAVGSGTILDLVGFTASTYCRGVAYTAVPTTLLGMVDAAIGGKNGINTPTCKNRIGTLYQPDRIFIDVNFLSTLPLIELQNGCVEMAKHALLDPSIAPAFKEALPHILAGDRELTRKAIQESIQVKLRIIKESEQNPERRHLLNLGHTIGHAIEVLEHFQISHGQAVAIGLMAEKRLFREDPSAVDSLIQAIGLPLKLSRSYSLDEWKQALQQDKKASKGRPRFVDATTQSLQFVEEETLHQVLKWVNTLFS